MNVAIAAMIAGRLRRRRRDHAVTMIHDTIVLLLEDPTFVYVYYNYTRWAYERPIRTCIVFLDHVQNLQIHAVRAKFY